MGPTPYHHEARASLLGGQPLDRVYQPYQAEPYQGGGYHHREGYAVASPMKTGPRMSWWYRPRSVWTWSFLVITLLQAGVCLGIEAYIFGAFQIALIDGASDIIESKTIITYLSIFIFGFIYQFILAYDALRLKNTIQVIGLCLYNLGLLVYSAVQVDQVRDGTAILVGKGLIRRTFYDEVYPYLVAVPCVIGLVTAVLSIVAWKLYDEFAWSIYKHISADLRLKRRFLTYQIYIALLKFDFFFFLGFTVQFLVVVTNTTTIEFYLTIAAVPITILILLLAAYFTRRESVLGMLAIIILYFAALAYFLFKLVRMYNITNNPERVRDYLPARRSLTTFAVITVVLLVVTIVNAAVCTRNFGKGLKPHIQRRAVPNAEDQVAPTIKLHGPVNGRMEID